MTSPDTRPSGIEIGDEGFNAIAPAVENLVDLVAQVDTPETPISPEKKRYTLTKTIAISGPSFSGKDSVVTILKERYGWRIYDGTQDGYRRRGEESGAPIERPKEAHDDFDARQAIMFSNLESGDEMWIHQTRLGPIILAAQIDERNQAFTDQAWEMQEGSLPSQAVKPIPAVSILLYTSDEVRLQRAIDHEKYLAGKENRKPRSKKAVIAEMRRKEADDAKSWQKAYGSVNIGDNPYSRRLTRNYGNPVYNRFVVTDGKTKEEVADAVIEMALQLGAIEEIKDSPEPIELIPDTEVEIDNSGVDHGEPMTYGKSFTHKTIVGTLDSAPTLEPA